MRLTFKKGENELGAMPAVKNWFINSLPLQRQFSAGTGAAGSAVDRWVSGMSSVRKRHGTSPFTV